MNSHFHDMTEVATPKQIREMMKVDGLTNDEVKSHLQVRAVHRKQSYFDPCQEHPHSINLAAVVCEDYCFTNLDSAMLIVQKYWLHNRRAPGSAMVSQPIVFVGGLWMPQEQSSSQSGSPQGPFHISTSSLVVSSAATVSCEEEDGRSESYGWK
jgi:hypothetical protein